MAILPVCAINVVPHGYDFGQSIIRYNFMIMSDWSTHIYDTLLQGKGGEPIGIRVFDESVGEGKQFELRHANIWKCHY